MSDDKSAKLLEWAVAKLVEAQRAGVYGTVTIFLEAGVITRAKTEMQHKPDLQEKIDECTRSLKEE